MSGAAHAAAAAAIAKAIKASGVVVQVTQEDFETILRKSENPLVIYATGGLVSTNYQYMTSYKGFTFFTKCRVPLILAPNTDIIAADKIWIPG